MKNVINLDEERLKKPLALIYKIQKSNSLSDTVMPKVMEELDMDDEGAIEMINSFIRLGWLSTGNVKEKYFLRPGYVGFFPIVISAAGIEKLK